MKVLNVSKGPGKPMTCKNDNEGARWGRHINIPWRIYVSDPVETCYMYISYIILILKSSILSCGTLLHICYSSVPMRSLSVIVCWKCGLCPAHLWFTCCMLTRHQRMQTDKYRMRNACPAHNRTTSGCLCPVVSITRFMHKPCCQNEQTGGAFHQAFCQCFSLTNLLSANQMQGFQ